MKTLTTMAFLAALMMSATVSARSMVMAEEYTQNRDYYVGAVGAAPCAAPCATTCAPPPCPCAPKVTTCCQKMERVCTPCGSVCCPEVRGLFDGGRCCDQ